MCARAIAGEWKLPLVKFDTAAVYDKYIGETEKRIQKVFQVAEGLAPCVLWIDELEKVFAGSGPDSASADAGVSSRLLAAFLSWMQDRKAPVFVAATCNNVSVLPPELIRKGRFDELFFVDLPNQAERKQIFAIQLSKRKRNPGEFSLDRRGHGGTGIFRGGDRVGGADGALCGIFAEATAQRSAPAGGDSGDGATVDHKSGGDRGTAAVGIAARRSGVDAGRAGRAGVKWNEVVSRIMLTGKRRATGVLTSGRPKVPFRFRIRGRSFEAIWPIIN